MKQEFWTIKKLWNESIMKGWYSRIIDEGATGKQYYPWLTHAYRDILRSHSLSKRLLLILGKIFVLKFARNPKFCYEKSYMCNIEIYHQFLLPWRCSIITLTQFSIPLQLWENISIWLDLGTWQGQKLCYWSIRKQSNM